MNNPATFRLALNCVLTWLLTALVSLTSLTAAAQTIRRVNNNVGITGPNVYATLQLAHDAAVAGDILHVEPSTNGYGGLAATKQLTILGPGYFLDLNQPPVLQVVNTTAQVGQLDFQVGSDGSTVSGLYSVSNIILRASNLTCVRNYAAGYIYVNYNNTNSGNVIRQNYVAAITYQNSGTASNMVITNNIVTSTMNLALAGFTGIFANNVVLGTSYFDNFTVKNNYLASISQTTANTTYQNNLFGGAVPVTFLVSTNNTPTVTQASTFVLGPGTTQYDAWYKLRNGSTTASGKGENGADIGAYGSLGLVGAGVGNAYRPSGLPAIPAIYQLSQVVNGANLNVTLSTRSNN